MQGFGVFVMILYPGAFVELENDEVEKLPPLGQVCLATCDCLGVSQ